MKALIDADILVYRVGFTTQEAPEWVAEARVNESIKGILNALGTSDYQCYLTATGKNNFRYAIYPEYKAKRLAAKPLHYDYIRTCLVDRFNALVIDFQEADDQLGIDQTIASSNGLQTCICSIDKDLDQIAGWHLNFVKGLKYEVTPLQGLYKFYHQLLTGDEPVDNIPGLRGIGPKKASKALEGQNTEKDMFNVVKQMYQNHYPDSWEKVMLRNGQLLKIRTTEGELWRFPDSNEESLLGSPLPLLPE